MQQLTLDLQKIPAVVILRRTPVRVSIYVDGQHYCDCRNEEIDSTLAAINNEAFGLDEVVAERLADAGEWTYDHSNDGPTPWTEKPESG
jgi:hypothetical protein